MLTSVRRTLHRKVLVHHIVLVVHHKVVLVHRRVELVHHRVVLVLLWHQNVGQHWESVDHIVVHHGGALVQCIGVVLEWSHGAWGNVW